MSSAVKSSFSRTGCSNSCRLGLRGASQRRVVVSRAVDVRCHSSPEQKDSFSASRRDLLSVGPLLASTYALGLTSSPSAQAQVVAKQWEKVPLPISKETVLLDVGFDGTDPNHGFLLGTRQTLLETKDGGKTWENREVPQALDEGINYRFDSISFNGKEGWIVGKPAILLHSTDGGETWERVPLSSKLPGSPVLITALPGEPGQAEMVTDQGAIYVTSNAGYNWTAAVQETVDATLNRTVSSGISGASYYEGTFSSVRRSPTGDYVAVSSRGNFYMTWSPGDTFWFPHNRPTARRVQAMGWDPDNKLWLTNRGGGLLLANKPGIVDTGDFSSMSIESRGFGLLDVGYTTDGSRGFACGGSGSLFQSTDGGKSWKRIKETDDVAGNLYEVKFFDPKRGYILGNNSIILRYVA